MTDQMNLGAELESITTSVDTAVADPNSTIESLKTLQTEVLGYKPLGRLRQLRKSLYSALDAAPARSEDKKTVKSQIANLRELENTLANKFDDAINAARDRKRANREAEQAQENTPEAITEN